MNTFTEKQIQGMISQLRDEYGSDIATRELAILELEDMQRKGCILSAYANRFNECCGCPKAEECPVLTWEKRHPEYKNDSLACKIKILEAGGEEAYKAKLKAQEEAKKKAEEEKNKATDIDRAEACRHLLNLYYKSKLTATAEGILELVNNILYAKTKSEIWDEVAKTT
jgi:hypothetical protein